MVSNKKVNCIFTGLMLSVLTVESKEPQVTIAAQENPPPPPASEAIVVNGILYKPANR